MSSNEHIDFETRTIKNPVGVSDEALSYALVFKTRTDRDNFVQRSQTVPKAVNLTIKVPEELVVALEDANQMCRSMYQIAARGGKDTNWPALTTRVGRELDRQEATLKMLRDDGQLKDATQPTDVSCRTCKGDRETCAEVPSLRHCEAANRETATQPPQVAEDYTEDKDVFEYLREKQALGYFTHPAIVKLMWMAQPPQATDAQRWAAMRTFDGGFDSYEKRGYAENGPDTGKAEGQLYFFWPEQVQQIKSALQSPAVPRGLTALIHDADSAVRHAQGFINMSGQKDLNEIQNATAWLNTAKENCIKALALLGGKEG